MNALRKAVLAVSCPLCGAGPGEACVDDPSFPPRLRMHRLDQWHGVRGEARGRNLYPFKVYAEPGVNPCSRCRKKNHRRCTGYHAHNHGMRGVPCTCECALAKRRETMVASQ